VIFHKELESLSLNTIKIISISDKITLSSSSQYCRNLLIILTGDNAIICFNFSFQISLKITTLLFNIAFKLSFILSSIDRLNTFNLSSNNIFSLLDNSFSLI
jgi:hypothetical protein